jgi:2-dehydropantoate 2-reductase
MRFTVIGAGAIGTWLGADLARAGHEVVLVARGAHLAAMREQGGVLVDGVHVPLSASDDPGDPEVVVLSVKAHDQAAAGALVAGSDVPVVAAQNGIPWWYFHGHPQHRDRRVEAVDPGGAVSAAIPPQRAIGCVVYSSTELEAPGIVRHVEGTRFSIGEPDGSLSERCRAFSEAMIAGGLKCPVEPDIRDDVWIKLMGNVAFNPLSALTRATLVAMCRHRPTRRLVVSLMEETLEIARRLGQTPEISIERRLAGAERVGEHRTSTLQDLEQGKRLELAPMTGALVELADLTQLEAPSLRAVGAAVELLDLTLAAR